MSNLTAVELLRFALAAIYTELDKEQANTEHCLTIADEALEMTRTLATPIKLHILGTGLESWQNFLEQLPKEENDKKEDTSVYEG